VRLLGSEATALCGREMRGEPVSAFDFGAFTTPWIAAFDTLLRSTRPTFAKGHYQAGGQSRELEAILLPLSGDGVRIDFILGALKISPAVLEERGPIVRVLPPTDMSDVRNAPSGCAGG
jgi:hypothetical protein